MLLDRIDIDVHGPLHHVRLGPFAEQLNVVYAPPGAGKTAIARFVRDSLLDREYPRGMLSASSGRVVWANRSGLVHCRREQDGTATGRRSVDFEARGSAPDVPSSTASWLSEFWHGSSSGRAIESLKLPESIVDGVITDTAITSLARVVSACVRAGLDSSENYQSVPLHGCAGDEQHNDREHRRLRRELAEIEAELARLEAEPMPPGIDPHRAHTRLAELHQRAHRLRARQSELYRWIEEIDRVLGREAGGPDEFTAATRAVRYQRDAAVADDQLRRKLDELDAQMIRWRRVLAEVRGLQRALLAADDRHFSAFAYNTFDDAALSQLRLRGFLHSIDHHRDVERPEFFYTDPYRPLHTIDDIDYRIDSATRQIDWLVARYQDSGGWLASWYEDIPATVDYLGTVGLGKALRRIRQDLQHVRAAALRGHAAWSDRPAAAGCGHHRDELRHAEQWLAAAIEQLDRRRRTLIRDAGFDRDRQASGLTEQRQHDLDLLYRDRQASRAELDRVTAELDGLWTAAGELRRAMRTLPVIDPRWYDDVLGSPHPAAAFGPFGYDPESRRSRLDVPLPRAERAAALHRRRDQILAQLHVTYRTAPSRSPLSALASQWLLRLSGGRLRQVCWPYRAFASDRRSYHRLSAAATGVTIDGRDELACPAADRALGVLAVRMAAGELLSQTGRTVPLLLETDATLSGMCGDRSAEIDPYGDHGVLSRSNAPLAAALRDYARDGRQVVLMTSDQPLADQVARVGARPFQIHARPVVHAHRPLWQPHYRPERYVGPHPHTYGNHDVPWGAQPQSTVTTDAIDINRDFDVAWREAYGVYDGHDRMDRVRRYGGEAVTSERTDWPRDGYEFRDGYYYSPSYTTTPAPSGTGVAPQLTRDGAKTESMGPPASPFFLTVDSPIDQAPSVDAVAAARLRGLQVTHVTHLMQQDANRLADALGLACVDAATIRSWQAECRLVCRVPHLRGFDARVLVGCGVTTPAQLAAIHPVDLLQKVESFLATERGQQILLSGSSHELSRITTWIAAANSGDENAVAGFGRHRHRGGLQRVARTRRSWSNPQAAAADARRDDPNYPFDSARYEYEGEFDSQRGRRRRSLRSSRQRTTGDGARRRIRDRAGLAAGSVRRDRASASIVRGSDARAERTGSGDRQPGLSRAKVRRQRRSRDLVSYATDERSAPQAADGEFKFYLHRDSPVVDAPSIGARMADRLNAIGIDTVDDLLSIDHESLAAQLNLRRVDAQTVLGWQQQATLVCRVPMLRGHDAQLLVAADVTTPEQLAACDADRLFAIIDPIARSSDGKRIIRGGKRPDLAEVTDWIRYGREHRELIAA